MIDPGDSGRQTFPVGEATTLRERDRSGARGWASTKMVDLCWGGGGVKQHKVRCCVLVARRERLDRLGICL